jgi:hypothetical protein
VEPDDGEARARLGGSAVIASLLLFAVSAGGTVVSVPGGRIEVSILGEPQRVSRAHVLAWVEGSARAVASYYGAFPVPEARVTINARGPGKVSDGHALGNASGAFITITVGQDTRATDLGNDWKLTHEFVHLAFPTMKNTPTWIEEGLATYIEPIARARAGRSKKEEIWGWLIRGLPLGEAALSQAGLDKAQGHDAMYWGGALFCFLADVDIRRRTHNRKSLDDAVRGIVRAGGNITVSWDLQRALAEGDRATGVPVLAPLYEKMGPKPVTPRVVKMLAALGVTGKRSALKIEDRAPLATIRRGIETGEP